MTQFESAYHEFKTRNAGVVFIAGQKIDGLFRGKEHIHKHKYPFPVLFDEKRNVTRAYASIKPSVWIHSILHGARCSSSAVTAAFAGSASARINGRRRHFEISWPLSKRAVNIEPHAEGVTRLKRIFCGCHWLLPGNHELERMTESGLLKSDR